MRADDLQSTATFCFCSVGREESESQPDYCERVNAARKALLARFRGKRTMSEVCVAAIEAYHGEF